jgi:hypothetical protein
MGFYINNGHKGDERLEITADMAKELLSKLFEIPPSVLSSLQNMPMSESASFQSKSAVCQHIGGYIEHLMYERNLSSVDITIEKDDDDQLIFNLNKTE